MRSRASLYAFEPGTPAVPAGSATGVFVKGLVDLLQAEPALEVRLQWLRPAGPRTPGRLGEWTAASRWLSGELSRMLWDRSRYLLFVYPKVPVLAHVDEPAMLALARRAYQALRAKAALTRQRIVVIVEDLPVELAEGRAAAGGPAVEQNVQPIRAIESTLLRAAHRLVAPGGFVTPIHERYGIDQARFRTFRRNVYITGVEPAQAPPIEFEAAEVNFFYSGSVDSHVASNFREILRAIRNAPRTRLHVCGPGRDAVREWLRELDVPNVRHYGLLGIAEHDWLAQRCDVGLILYPTDNLYNHLTPTMKYSAYLANGLAVLSTDLRCVAENIRQDGVGRAMPIRELALELLRWATRPALWSAAKASAEEQAEAVRSGVEMKAWIEEIARDE